MDCRDRTRRPVKVQVRRAVNFITDRANVADLPGLRVGPRVIMLENQPSQPVQEVVRRHDGVHGVSVITCTNRIHNLDNILSNFSRQIHSPKELIVVANNNAIDLADWKHRAGGHPDIRFFQLDGSVELGECLNFGINQAKFDFIARFDDDDYYGPGYLCNTMHLFPTLDADIIGKGTMHVHFEGSNTLALCLPGFEHQSVGWVAGATIFARRHVFDKVRFRNVSAGEDDLFLKDCVNAGIRIFSGDRFDFCCIRHADISRHTWKVTEEEFMRSCVPVSFTSDFFSFVDQKIDVIDQTKTISNDFTPTISDFLVSAEW